MKSMSQSINVICDSVNKKFDEVRNVEVREYQPGVWVGKKSSKKLVKKGKL